jgi:beta-lactamase class A
MDTIPISKIIMKKTIIRFAVTVSIMLNLILAFFLLTKPSIQTLQKTENSRLEFPYLSPRIFMENQNDILINFTLLRERLLSYSQSFQSTIGIYFEYLPSGVSIGINEKEPFVLASLLKVPLVMGVYNQINLEKLKKTDVLTITEKNLDHSFGTLWEKGPGTPITVEEAVRLALQKSDNTATSVLFTNIPSGVLSEVFDYLDIPKELNSASPVVTAKNYSSVLRSLYLSSYLPPQYSNEILNILAKTEFKDKLPAGVPDNVTIAHKIGVYETDNPKDAAYTDCGIVYVPKRPYILCVMVKDNEKNASKYIKEVSSIVYTYVVKSNHLPK